MAINKDAQGLPLSRGEYAHPEPRATNSLEWRKPQTFAKLQEAKAILMAVPGGWEEVSLPDDYAEFKGKKDKPKVLHVMWNGSRVQASLAALRIPKIQPEKKKGGSWFYGN